jgi:hypothetical protein
MGAGRDPGAALQKPLDGRERGPHAQIVVDVPIDERDIEIGTKEYRLALDRGQVLEQRQVHRSQAG